MEIKLTPAEAEEYFYNALCNGASYIQGSGVEIDVEKPQDYKTASNKLKAESKSPCIEDVWMEVLRMGNKLQMTDVEGEGEYTRTITLQDVHDRVEKTPIDHLSDMINEQDDATTADVILQTVFLQEVIFG